MRKLKTKSCNFDVKPLEECERRNKSSGLHLHVKYIDLSWEWIGEEQEWVQEGHLEFQCNNLGER